MLNSLIVTMPGDTHSHAVAWALKQRGQNSIKIFPLDLSDGATWSFQPNNNTLQVDYKGDQSLIHIDEIRSVWWRRVSQIYPLPAIADLKERAAAETEIAHFTMGVFYAIEKNAFNINPITTSFAAERKAFQLAMARGVGFSVPSTVISNDFTQISEFYKKVGGRMAYKPLALFLWDRDDHHRTMALTTEITDLNILAEANIQASPSIYQEIIERHGEVRVTVMGRSVFAWMMRPKDGVTVDIDWRRLRDDSVVYEKHELPAAVQELCFRLMDKLGIVFGCFDLALTPNGEYIFFEVNAGGQFLFGDALNVGLTQLDAFTKFIESRDPKFVYKETSDVVTFKHFIDETDYENELKVEVDQHFGHVARFNYARASVGY